MKMKQIYECTIYFLDVCFVDLIARPVIIEVPHFASLRGKEREIVILRSDNGDTWREHTLDASEEAVQDVLNESFEGEGKIYVFTYVIFSQPHTLSP
jgi:hypothetical protein